MYQIQPYSYFKAKHLGVKLIPSMVSGKKIDVLDWHNNYITSIGDINYLEMEEEGKVPKGYANERRRLYHLRHSKEPVKLGDKYLGSPAYYAKELLW